MVTDSGGQIGRMIGLPSACAKNGSGCRIPLHDDLRRALKLLAMEYGEIDGPVISSERVGKSMTAKSIVNWFHHMYAQLGLEGCSSHSGWRFASLYLDGATTRQMICLARAGAKKATKLTGKKVVFQPVVKADVAAAKGRLDALFDAQLSQGRRVIVASFETRHGATGPSFGD
jgi:hypothetical protein